MTGISIILPTYNRASLLPRALTSIRAQTFEDYELIIIDDGSEDNTDEVVHGFVDAFCGRLRYIKQNNSGASVARNAGINRATKELVAFMDSDDVWQPEKLLLQVELMREQHASASFTDFYTFNDRGVVTGHHIAPAGFAPTVYPKLFEVRYNVIVTPSVIVRKSSLLSSGLFDPELSICEDIDLWGRVSRKQEFVHIPRPLVGVHIREGDLIDLSASISARAVLYGRAIDSDASLSRQGTEWADELLRIYADLATLQGRGTEAAAINITRGAIAESGNWRSEMLLLSEALR